MLIVTSLNINGLNLLAMWGVEQLIRKYNTDVFCLSETHFRFNQSDQYIQAILKLLLGWTSLESGMMFLVTGSGIVTEVVVIR